jgi:hypothetical protein
VTRPSWWVDPAKSGQKPGCNPLTFVFFFLLKQHHFKFFFIIEIDPTNQPDQNPATRCPKVKERKHVVTGNKLIK